MGSNQVSIFTTKTSVEDFYLCDNAWFKIICKLNRVYVDEDPFSEIDDTTDPDENVFLTLEGMGVDIVDDEKDFINNIPNDHKSVLKYPCGIYLLRISDKKAEQIQENYGVICQSIDKLDDTPLTRSNHSNELVQGENGITWSNLLGEFRLIPSNSLLIIDAHLFENDAFDERTNSYDPNRQAGLDNLYEIIDTLLPNNFADEYHVGIMVTDTDKAKAARKSRTNLTNDRISKAIQGFKKKLNRPYNINIELIFFDLNDDRHKLIHNRRIMSNYIIVTADYKLAAIRNRRSVEGQSVIAFPLFENIQQNPNSDKKEKRVRNDLAKFTEFFNSQMKSVANGGTISADFRQNNRKMQDFSSMKHRLLRIN